jgi:hypothetical protein
MRREAMYLVLPVPSFLPAVVDELLPKIQHVRLRRRRQKQKQKQLCFYLNFNVNPSLQDRTEQLHSQTHKHKPLHTTTYIKVSSVLSHTFLSHHLTSTTSASQ